MRPRRRRRAALHPVRIGTGTTVRALGFNRVRAAGPIDRSLHVLRIDGLAGTPSGPFQPRLSSRDHRPATDAGTAISADWPGQVARRLHGRYGEAIFRLGVCGDVDPVVAWHQFAFEGWS